MKSFQAERSGPRWVVESFDSWIMGPNPERIADGSWRCPGSVIDVVVKDLKPIEHSTNVLMSLGEPRLRIVSSPDVARSKRETYAVEIVCPLRVNDRLMRDDVRIGRFPVMVGTRLDVDYVADPYDGGYFILQGVERAYVNRESVRFEIPATRRRDRAVDVRTKAGNLRVVVENGDTTTMIFGNADPIDVETVVRAYEEEEEDVVPKSVKSKMDAFLSHVSSPEEIPAYVRSLVNRCSGTEFDPDAMHNKRIDSGGRFVTKTVRAALPVTWKKITDKIRKSKRFEPEAAFASSSHLETTVRAALRSGKDTCVVPRRGSWWESVAVVRRVVARLSESSRAVGPRLFHGTWYGFYCACETQEGERTGLARETALFFRLSPPYPDHEGWIRRVREGRLGSGQADVYLGESKIVSGVDAEIAYEFCFRTKIEFDTYAGTFVDSNGDVRIEISEGRPLRPVWNLLRRGRDDDEDFDTAIREGRIVWIDASTVAASYVATGYGRPEPFHTFEELHPTALLGPSAANVPFLDRNPGSRNLFGAHVRHQAVGDAPWVRNDETNRLWNAQRALCDTIPARTMRSHVYPGGWNAVVMIVAKPLGQEDSIGISKRTLELGAANAETCTWLEARGRFACVPPRPKILADGTPKIGQSFDPGETLVVRKDGTSALKWTGKRPAVVVDVRKEDETHVRVRTKWTRPVVVGDKFATRHGQKGVVNFVFDEDDTYWTSDGIRPDVILNPHCLPTRMTVGNLFETLCAKLNALDPPEGWSERGCEGTVTDCTPYSRTFDYEEIKRRLVRLGYQPKGNETVYSSKTGLPLECGVFVGPMFVQRLTHFAEPKCHARGRGKKNGLTGQPTKGRTNDGGLKLGEMETKAIVAYGATGFLSAAYLDGSDGVDVGVCTVCGEIGPCCRAPLVKRKVPRSFVLVRDRLKVAKIHARLVPPLLQDE